MDRLDAMATLLAARKAGSLSAASRALGAPLASVSRRIAELEAHLGTQLLVRTRRGLLLTEAGEAFCGAAQRILDELEEAERQASGEYRAPRGELTIAAPVAFGRLHVLPVVQDFLRAYPQIDLRLALSDQITDLAEAHVDAALRIGNLADSSLRSTVIGQICHVVCASPGYFAAHGVPRHPQDLAAHDCIAFDRLGDARLWRFGAGPASMAVAVRMRLSVSTADAAHDAAVAGLGITRLYSYQVAESVRAGRLVTALSTYQPPQIQAQLLHAGASLMPLKLRAFLDFAAPRLRARLQGLDQQMRACALS